jgi:methanogenic corrinoid protein MtbC1
VAVTAPGGGKGPAAAPGGGEQVGLRQRIADLDEPGALQAVQALAAAGRDPLAIIDECQRGMQDVGDSYQRGKYFISGLIMAGEIFREAMEILAPLMLEARHEGTAGTVLLCTVQGDIHDIGKGIVETLLRSHGFEVHDIGVDVPAAEVARRAIELRPDIVGLSGLLTSATAGIKATIDELRAAPEIPRALPIIIGGGAVCRQVSEWAGTDLWARDAVHGVGLIRDAVVARGPNGLAGAGW